MQKTATALACALFILLIAIQAQATGFTEIMYDPPGSDNNLEFLELEDAPDLEGWQIADNSSNDTLVTLQRNASSRYALIVEEGFLYGGMPCSIYSAGPTIGNNLNNDADIVRIFSPNGTEDAATEYDARMGGNGDGRSLERVNGSWHPSTRIGGSPCFPTNSSYNTTENETDQQGPDVSIRTAIPQEIYTLTSYDSLFRITNERHVAGQTDAIDVTANYFVEQNGSMRKNGSFTVTVNSHTTAGTGTLRIDLPGNYTLCGEIVASTVNDTNASNDHACADLIAIDASTIPCNLSLRLEIENEQRVYEQDARIAYRLRIDGENSSAHPFVGTYGASTIFGERVFLRTTENEQQKSFTPRCEERVCAYLLTAELAAIACNNSGNATSDERLLVVKGEGANVEQQRQDSSITITGVKPTAPRFGDILDVTLELYKGNTTKESVQVWIEKGGKRVSETTRISIDTKFSKLKLTVPVALKETGTAGNHVLVVEGLSERTTGSVAIAAEKSTNKSTNATKTVVKSVPRIASFYTRARAYHDEIALYARLEGAGSGEAEFLNERFRNRQKTSFNRTVNATVPLVPGPNLYLLRLWQNGTIATEHALLLLVENGTVETMELFQTFRTAESCQQRRGEENATRQERQRTDTENSVTGDVIFENERETRMLPALLFTTALLGGAVWLLRRKETSQSS